MTIKPHRKIYGRSEEFDRPLRKKGKANVFMVNGIWYIRHTDLHKLCWPVRIEKGTKLYQS